MAVFDVRQTLTLTSPYADTPIRLSMLSTSTERYKTYYCPECRHPFLERDNDQLYRINTNNQPGRVYMDNDGLIVSCGKCRQKFIGSVVIVSMPTHNYPQRPTMQSIYITPAPQKRLRNLGCMECGKAFCSVTDRIAMVVDNVAPVEYLPEGRIGMLEVRCKSQRCGQAWALML